MHVKNNCLLFILDKGSEPEDIGSERGSRGQRCEDRSVEGGGEVDCCREGGARESQGRVAQGTGTRKRTSRARERGREKDCRDSGIILILQLYFLMITRHFNGTDAVLNALLAHPSRGFPQGAFVRCGARIIEIEFCVGKIESIL